LRRRGQPHRLQANHALARRTPANFKRGDVLFMQGARHATDFLVTSGAIQTYYVSPLGKEITLAYWSTGDFLGGPDFLGGISF